MYNAEEHPGCDAEMRGLLDVLRQAIEDSPKLGKDPTGTARHVVVLDTVLPQDVNSIAQGTSTLFHVDKASIARVYHLGHENPSSKAYHRQPQDQILERIAAAVPGFNLEDEVDGHVVCQNDAFPSRRGFLVN